MTIAPDVPAMVDDPGGLAALVDALEGEEYYGFDTEFHTERTYVPDLALIQIAWADQVALVDPLAVDPAPLAPCSTARAWRWPTPPGRTSTSCSPPAEPARPRFRHPDRGRVPRHVVALPVPTAWTRFSGSPCPRPIGCRTGCERPISERQTSYAVNDVAHLLELRRVLSERLSALGRLDWALERV